jgi:quinol monooxygenase YgiN
MNFHAEVPVRADMKSRWVHWAWVGLLTTTLTFAAGRYVGLRESQHSGALRAMNEIQGISRLRIREGKLDDFKRVASRFLEVARTRDTGTLQYELYSSEDQTEWIVLERYRDVPSLLEHRKNVSGLLDDLLKTCSVGGSDVCGTATPEPVRISV